MTFTGNMPGIDILASDVGHYGRLFSESHRTWAALRAIACFFLVESFAALAFPPPFPRRPSSTAAEPLGVGALGSSDSPVAMPTVRLRPLVGVAWPLGLGIDPSMPRSPEIPESN